MTDCQHTPPCPSTLPRHVCNTRTATEAAIKRRLVTREAGAALLAKYGVPMTPASTVYRGAPEPDEQERFW